MSEEEKLDWLKSETKKEVQLNRESETFEEDLYKHLCEIIE